MEYREGLFGVLNMDEMENEPLVLLDGGIECRCGEAYDFYNGNRTEYGGFLFQYTLRGEGLFVRNGRECLVKKGSGFFVRFPEEAGIVFRMSRELSGNFFIFILRETLRMLSRTNWQRSVPN